MAVASLVLGILGLIFSLIPFLFFVGVPLAIVATVLGVVARRSATEAGQPTGTATAGLVLGIIGVTIGLAFMATCGALVKTGREMAKDPKKLQEAFKENKEFNEAFKKALEESAKQEEGSSGVPLPGSPAALPASPASAPASPSSPGSTAAPAAPASPVVKEAR